VKIVLDTNVFVELRRPLCNPEAVFCDIMDHIRFGFKSTVGRDTVGRDVASFCTFSFTG
jgi:hypothetical protein